MASGITTYCCGPALNITRDVSKADLMQICDRMGCRPEPISEGGLVYVGVPGYKSLRLKLYSAQPIHRTKTGQWRLHERDESPDKWPWITSSTLSTWRNDAEVVIHAGQRIATHLKAFDQAPAFTVQELQQWRSVLGEFGICMGHITKPSGQDAPRATKRCKTAPSNAAHLALEGP